MARITVEDCINKVPNRFKLVLLAAQRARNISAGSPLEIERDNDKNTVASLREIADEKLDLASLQEGIIKRLRRVIPSEEELDTENLPKIDPAPEMNEEDLLKALQNDQDSSSDSR